MCPPMTSPPDHIGTADAAEILGCSTTKVKMLAQSGQLPIAFKMGGRTGAYLFSRSAIEHIARRAA